MNNSRLLTVGGILNTLLALFHVYLNWAIFRMTTLSPENHALMEMLGIGGMLLIFLFAYASLFCRENMLNTQLGKAVIVTIVLTYASRAVGEVVFSPDFSAMIFVVCLIITGIYVGLLIRLPRLPVQAEQSYKAS